MRNYGGYSSMPGARMGYRYGNDHGYGYNNHRTNGRAYQARLALESYRYTWDDSSMSLFTPKQEAKLKKKKDKLQETLLESYTLKYLRDMRHPFLLNDAQGCRAVIELWEDMFERNCCRGGCCFIFAMLFVLFGLGLAIAGIVIWAQSSGSDRFPGYIMLGVGSLFAIGALCMGLWQWYRSSKQDDVFELMQGLYMEIRKFALEGQQPGAQESEFHKAYRLDVGISTPAKETPVPITMPVGAANTITAPAAPVVYDFRNQAVGHGVPAPSAPPAVATPVYDYRTDNAGRAFDFEKV